MLEKVLQVKKNKMCKTPKWEKYNVPNSRVEWDQKGVEDRVMMRRGIKQTDRVTNGTTGTKFIPAFSCTRRSVHCTSGKTR